MSAMLSLRRVLAFDHAALTIHDPRTDGLRVVAMEGRALSDQFSVSVVFNRKDSYCGWAFDHQRPIARPDISATPEYSTRHRVLAAGIRSLCTAPLIRGGRSIGTLNGERDGGRVLGCQRGVPPGGRQPGGAGRREHASL